MLNEYKHSNYTLCVPVEDGTGSYILFNMLSGSLAVFNSETYARFVNYELTEKEIEECVKRRFLISPEEDELAKINGSRIDGIHMSNGKNFRIWTTSACNARCYYCFEKGMSHCNMNMETAKATVDFICSCLSPEDEVLIEWFGGEPLINTEVIDYITDALDAFCADKNIKVSYAMISNGSLIDEALAQKISNDWHIKSIQITLDGMGSDYDNAKNYYNKTKYNFDSVINSIHLLNENNVHVGIRLNYDTHNYQSLVSLINFLSEEFDHSKVSCYVYPVWTSLLSDNDQFVSQSKADEQYFNLLKLIIELKMGTVQKVLRLGFRKHQCHACHEYGFSILPDGKLGKCDETFNQVIGNVWDGIVDNETYSYWTSHDLEEECINCKYLPMCQGGCRSSRFNNMPKCFAHKTILPQILKWIVEQSRTNK